MGFSGASRFLGEEAVVVDVRGIFDEGEVEGKGFCYRRL
ncbi:MAG: hypothetical protein KFBDDELM_00065 [Candidatus Argoarchaeum ethanivorans]|uniref:Uncharacterized protein n=1 Tax=Candidatus Argoarchaeum ethanivorans TaxID=2608793 RepID=A0A811T3D7_9EURY|nr:MAG: hypothetical protein KFBDDELM_00065 [Candidatus Argoarchaeum ethanivorans]